MAGAKKNAARQGRTIVFVDESGLSERRTRVRTWAPRGHTPVLQYSFSWHQLSAIAGVIFWQFYFRLFPGAIKGPQLVEFLRALRRQIPGKLLIIWDGLQAHKSRVVRRYVEQSKGAIQLEFLPAYVDFDGATGCNGCHRTYARLAPELPKHLARPRERLLRLSRGSPVSLVEP